MHSVRKKGVDERGKANSVYIVSFFSPSSFSARAVLRCAYVKRARVREIKHDIYKHHHRGPKLSCPFFLSFSLSLFSSNDEKKMIHWKAAASASAKKSFAERERERERESAQ